MSSNSDKEARRRAAAPPQRSQGKASDGSILLEVVLALALFVAAATIISSGLNASVEAVHRLRQDSHAVNLAVTVLSEMQMHIRPVVNAGPEPFAAPFELWTWQVEVTPLEEGATEADAMRRVEVTIRHTEDNVVQRLAQVFRASDSAPETGIGTGLEAGFP